jgi:hypothetical protein
MKLSVTTYLAIALGLSLTGNCVQLYLAGGQKPKSELKQANGVIQADKQQAKDTANRDKAGDKIDRESKADTNAKVGKAEGQKNDRAQAIDRVPVNGSCRAPVGLPDLAGAVDQANAAAGN